ncbi:MAG: uracil-DNA glycosylase [Deltaproteobacteria bacterium]|nr:uracil-DNA glycosylase [Deltaproteobacteria bacterium]
MSNQLREEFLSLVSGTRSLLEDMRDLGIEEVLFPPPMEPPAPQSAYETDAVLPGPVQVAETLSEGLEDICRELDGCRRCPLCEGRNRLVFGGGNPQAELVFVGEAPGREEDRQGIPFVGEAGQLLERILFAMNLHRDDVYICNVIKCRPPGNRDPKPEEIEACEPFLKRQLAVIRPKVLVTLGKFAAQTLLRERMPISRLRGHWREYEGIPLMPTYHPAFLLRNPASKKEVWIDMKKVMEKLFSAAK